MPTDPTPWPRQAGRRRPSRAQAAPEECEPLKETAYLLRNPENARRVLASIDRLENGGGTVGDPTRGD